MRLFRCDICGKFEKTREAFTGEVARGPISRLDLDICPACVSEIADRRRENLLITAEVQEAEEQEQEQKEE